MLCIIIIILFFNFFFVKKSENLLDGSSACGLLSDSKSLKTRRTLGFASWFLANSICGDLSLEMTHISHWRFNKTSGWPARRAADKFGCWSKRS